MAKKSIGDTPVSQMTYRMYLIGQATANGDLDSIENVFRWVDRIIARLDEEHAEDAPELSVGSDVFRVTRIKIKCLDKNFNPTLYDSLKTCTEIEEKRGFISPAEAEALLSELMVVANKHTYKPGEHDE